MTWKGRAPAVIDLHSHILPGLDDGPANLDEALALARAARDAGTTVMTATPHVRDDHPFPLEAIGERAELLLGALADAGVELEVVTGAEVAITKAAELEDAALETLCLGSGSYLLVESPYTEAPSLLEQVLLDLEARGFVPMLAHPERSPSFLSDEGRLPRLVEEGILCSVTAPSMTGAFGPEVRRFAARLFSEGLVHNVASDAHDLERRPPGLRRCFEDLESELPGLSEQIGWFTEGVPEAILAGRELPPRPGPPTPGRGRLRSFLARRSMHS